MANKKIFITTIAFFLTLFSFCQEKTKEKKLTLNGSLDTYFKSNLNTTNKSNTTGNSTATSFANDLGFALGMANIIAKYKRGKVGAVADLVFGPRGEEATFLSNFLKPNGSSNVINQLYVYIEASDKLTLTLGNFNTFLGYEVISPTGNFNYSTSYMFSNGPFSHTGLKADISFSEDLSLMLAIMNSTDYTEFNPDGKYSIGAQLGYKSNYLNIIYGNQTNLNSFLTETPLSTKPTFHIDYTGGFDISEKFFLGINTTYNNTDNSGFYGAALYPLYKSSKKLSLGIRGEYFGTYEDNTNDDNTIFAATLSANYKIDDLTIIPEIRIDNGSNDIFVDNNLAPQNTLSSFLIAAIYSF